jgi:mxaJ protein
MYSRFPKLLGTVFVFLAVAAAAQNRELKVCADPQNLPFSNVKQQGFENHLAQLVARDLNARVTYVWQRMGRGFVREFINSSRCDMVIGVPSRYAPLLTTSPYYRSTYVFVSRRKPGLQLTSIDDPELRQMKIGVQVLDEEYTPPGAALARRGLQNEIVGFETTGEQADSIIRAVADGKVDTAIVWGPLAGYFAQRLGSKLQLTPVTPEVDPPGVPFTFAISMGVRKGNLKLRDELETFIAKRQIEIHKLLSKYGVPQLELPPQQKEGE